MRVRLTGVAKRFGERQLFENLDVEVAAGEMVALTGPSGSGKTTLLTIMSALLEPDSGKVELVNGDPDRPRPMRAHLASWIPQGNNMLGARTVLDNAMIGALAAGGDRSHAQELAEHALGRMGIDERRDDHAAVLSGGEQQRLAIARALCSGRPFLFADEPTGSLDRTNTEMVVAALRRAADEGIAVIIATHNLAIAPHCDRVFVIDGDLQELT